MPLKQKLSHNIYDISYHYIQIHVVTKIIPLTEKVPRVIPLPIQPLPTPISFPILILQEKTGLIVSKPEMSIPFDFVKARFGSLANFPVLDRTPKIGSHIPILRIDYTYKGPEPSYNLVKFILELIYSKVIVILRWLYQLFGKRFPFLNAIILRIVQFLEAILLRTVQYLRRVGRAFLVRFLIWLTEPNLSPRFLIFIQKLNKLVQIFQSLSFKLCHFSRACSYWYFLKLKEVTENLERICTLLIKNNGRVTQEILEILKNTFSSLMMLTGSFPEHYRNLLIELMQQLNPELQNLVSLTDGNNLASKLLTLALHRSKPLVFTVAFLSITLTVTIIYQSLKFAKRVLFPSMTKFFSKIKQKLKLWKNNRSKRRSAKKDSDTSTI